MMSTYADIADERHMLAKHDGRDTTSVTID